MLRLTLAQMRRSLGRLSAAAVAIAIGAAFLATTLIAGGVITRTGYDAVTATYGQADVVVRGQLTPQDAAPSRATPGRRRRRPAPVSSRSAHAARSGCRPCWPRRRTRGSAP